MLSRKRIIIAIIALFVVVGIACFFLLQDNKSSQPGSNAATKSHVEQGETVDPNTNGSGQTAGTGTSSTNDQNSTNNSQTTTANIQPTTQQFYDQIILANGVAPDADGQVRFGVTDVKQPIPGWYVVTIVKTGVEPNKVIFKQTGDASNPISIYAGPGTSFPPDSVFLPDAVRKAL